MNALLLTAAGIMLAVGAAHSYLGERFILVRLFRRSDLPQLFGSDRFTRRTLRLAWHLTTVVWWGIAALIIAVARDTSGTLLVARLGAIIAVTSLVSAVVAFVLSRGQHLSWLAFLVIGVLVWAGTR